MIRRILASMILIGLGLFLRITARSVDREVEESEEQAGEGEERPESSPSSPDDNNADESAEFDVFLSFRGEDTQKSFTDNLHHNLTTHGVKAFIGSENLRKGERIHLLHRYVQRSKVFLPVFSKGYADSEWCLRELSTAVKCNKKIIPVFFNVEPSDLRGGDGCFARSFQKHAKNKKLDPQEVKGWADASKEAGSISGYVLQDDATGFQTKFIQMIVKDVMTICVGTNLLDVAEHPVGLKPRVEEIKGLLRLQDFEGNGVVRVIGIHGMGGMGKTTLAKAVYNEIERNFDTCIFLFDVREISTMVGLQSLQARMVRDISGQNNDEHGIHNITDISSGKRTIKKVASCKKVLVILDDVGHRDQLEALVGGGDWFGKGSRIIITTRHKSLLIGHGIEEGNMYAIDGLDKDDSMKLFCYHAFRSSQPPDERFQQLAEEVVPTMGGLPLALEVLGSGFFGRKDPEEWKSLIRKLEKYRIKDVHDPLRISYDELDECEKQVFLDIACFFIGRDIEYPMLMWEACEFYPSVAIKVLLHKSLIKMTTRYDEWKWNLPEEEVFAMHDQIRDMGRNIVLQERGEEKHFENFKELRSVQGIDFYSREEPIPANLWERYPQLRYLRGERLTFQGTCLQLPASLKWLSLTECGLEQPSTYDFDPGKSIVILELPRCSHLARALVEQSFLGRRKVFESLKVLDLRGTTITTTPDFSNVPCPNLEKIILCGCAELRTVHESIGQLKMLGILDLEGCTQLSSLPITVGGMTSLEKLVLDLTGMKTLPNSTGELRNLKELSLSYCEKLSSLPNTLGGLASLEELVLDGTKIETLPDWIGELRNLRKLHLGSCEKLSSLPATLGGLTSLEVLVANGSYIETMPHSIGKLTNLKGLFLTTTWVEHLSDSIGKLTNLRVLDLSWCGGLHSLPNTLGDMTALEELKLDNTWIKTLPDSTGELTKLRVLRLRDTRIENLPDSIGKLTNLRVLDLSECIRLYSLPSTLGDMTALEELKLDRTSIKALPDSIGELTNLRELSLGYCARLKVLPHSIRKLSSLKSLGILETR